MRGHNQHPVGSFATVLALAAIVGCQVQLVEQHDPRISQGLSDYQLALEDFTLKVLDSYAQCDLYRSQFAEIRKVDCSIEPVATRNACQARKDKDAADAGAKAEQACTTATQASYKPRSGGCPVNMDVGGELGSRFAGRIRWAKGWEAVRADGP